VEVDKNVQEVEDAKNNYFILKMSLLRQQEYVLTLPENIKQSITWYTGGSYDEFNTALRSGNIPKDKNHFENISLAFQGVPPLTESITVYKGKKSESIYKTDKAFASTSINIRGTRDFHGQKCCIMQILVSPGSKVLPLAPLSDHQREQEILLDRDANYALTGSDLKIIEDDFKVQFDIKFLFVTYLPKQSVMVGKELSKIPDPGKKDENALQERLVMYLEKLKKEEDDPDLFDADIELDSILKREKLEINSKVRKAILLRLSI